MATLAEEKPTLRHLSSIDGGLVMSVLLLSAIGLATVHSASSEMPVDYLPRQALWLGVGVLLLVAAMSIDYHLLLDFSIVLYAIGLVLLVLVLVAGISHGGAAHWARIGPFQFQPSEFAKLATILFLARYLSGLNRRVLALPQILVAVVIVAVPMVLVLVEPDLGSSMMFAPILLGMLLVAGGRLRSPRWCGRPACGRSA